METARRAFDTLLRQVSGGRPNPLADDPKVQFELYSGAGNRFLLTESAGALARAPELARELCATHLFEGEQPDGLLILSRTTGGDPRMTILNSDGSRPEACGNGLRCVGWHLARGQASSEFRIETDAGPRQTSVLEKSDRWARLRAEMGPVRVTTLDLEDEKVPGLLASYQVKVGNPHAVLLVEDERDFDSRELNRRIRSRGEFSQGVNLGLIAHRGGRWHLRVNERGVGETDACGTGASAAVASLAAHGLVPGEGQTVVQMAGGDLCVRLHVRGTVELEGEATYHGSLPAGMISTLGGAWAISSRS